MTSTAERLASALTRFPRVSLVRLPTPVIEAPRLSEYLGGPHIFIKREDLAGFGVGGSKFRILEFTLGTALSRGANLLIAGGYVQSNHPQQVAVAAARLNVPVLLLLSDAESELAMQGNPLLARLAGAEIRVIPGADLDRVRKEQDLVMAEMRAQGRFPAIVTLTRDVYVLSVLAYTAYTFELLEQLQQMKIGIDALYVGSGGGTYAGMLFGALALGRPFRVIGFTPTGTAQARSQYVRELIEEAMALIDIVVPVPRDAIEIYDNYIGEGHGIPSAGAAEAISVVASTEGIYLDPIYAGKAMAGLLHHVRTGKARHKAVVFAHTGGLPALFAFADRVVPK